MSRIRGHGPGLGGRAMLFIDGIKVLGFANMIDVMKQGKLAFFLFFLYGCTNRDE